MSVAHLDIQFQAIARRQRRAQFDANADAYDTHRNAHERAPVIYRARASHRPENISAQVANLAVAFALPFFPNPFVRCPPAEGIPSRGFYDPLLSTMKNGRTLGQSGRFAQLAPVIRKTFDVPTMARLSVGPSWATLTEAQRQQMTESFGRYISDLCRPFRQLFRPEAAGHWRAARRLRGHGP